MAGLTPANPRQLPAGPSPAPPQQGNTPPAPTLSAPAPHHFSETRSSSLMAIRFPSDRIDCGVSCFFAAETGLGWRRNSCPLRSHQSCAGTMLGRCQDCAANQDPAFTAEQIILCGTALKTSAT